MNKETVFIMAAGKGERLRPYTLTTPKPLIKVKNKPMIETVIDGLQKRNISKIYVVVGYLKEKFSYLPKKYSNVELVENKEYDSKNNISSLHAIVDFLGLEDCFITDGDLFLSDASFLENRMEYSTVFGKFFAGKTNEWCYHLKDSFVNHLGPGGENEYTMSGITYLKKSDASVLANEIRKTYEQKGHEQLFWDNILDQNLDKIQLKLSAIDSSQIVEIDTVDELQQYEMQ